MSSKKENQEIDADTKVDIKFSQLGLDDRILKALGDLGYEKPTPIQAKAIPAAIKQRDVLGIAQTGTGKTGAFTLPTMHKLASGRARARMPRCLIVCPTRELAAQVAENVEQYGKYLKLEMALLIGGVSFAEQEKKLMRGVDILIATPGRLLDQFDRGKILMTGVQTLVVDEADRMLDMGFKDEIDRILNRLPPKRQTLLFSATFDDAIFKLSKTLLNEPKLIEVSERNTAATQVEQIVYTVDADRKRELTSFLIGSKNWRQVLIFTRTKHGANKLTQKLIKAKISSAAIHGNKSQGARTKALKNFKENSIRVLVATDIAARGLDIPLLPHVINYELPNVPEDYVHRIGRTGRAGAEGEAISLVCSEETEYQNEIEKLLKEKLKSTIVAGFEPTDTAPPKRAATQSKGSFGKKNKGGSSGSSQGNKPKRIE